MTPTTHLLLVPGSSMGRDLPYVSSVSAWLVTRQHLHLCMDLHTRFLALRKHLESRTAGYEGEYSGLIDRKQQVAG